MIVTELKKLREIPVGEVVTLVMQFKVVKTTMDVPNICESCVFDENGCCQCMVRDRTDGKSVKFIKI